MSLDSGDAAELAEMLEFLSDWLARDPVRPGASLAAFIGSRAYGTRQLQADLDRFVFLLGGSDGERLFQMPGNDDPLRNDNVTTSGPAACCPVCSASFTPVRRQRYCTPACRQKAFRRRQPAPPPPAPAPGPGRRSASIYQCGECDQRYLGDQWCHDCNRPCRRLGHAGLCPICDEPVLVTDLVSHSQ